MPNIKTWLTFKKISKFKVHYNFNSCMRDVKSSIIFLLLLLWLISTITIGWAAKDIYGGRARLSGWPVDIVEKIVSIPHLVKSLYETALSYYGSLPIRMLIKNGAEKNHEFGFPCKDDDGYLLLSGMDPFTRNANIRLISIHDGKTIKLWQPDWSDIDRQSAEKTGKRIDIGGAMAVHPLPLANGKIFFNVQNIAVIIDSESRAEVLDFISHHSNELNCDGTGIVTPSIATGFYGGNSYLEKRLRDDSILTASIEGKLIEIISFSRVLFDNDLDSLLFGHSGTESISSDPIHINQISIACMDGEKWKKGDLLISARHLSAVFLYRPANRRIIWYQVGPWKNQHSVHFVDNAKIALLDNNVYGYDESMPPEQNFVNPSDVNRIFVIDFSSGVPVVTEPYRSTLEAFGLKPRTITEGRVQVLPDNGLFFEETNNGLHFRIANGRLIWLRINRFNEKFIGRVGWCRYLSKKEVESFINISGFF